MKSKKSATFLVSGKQRHSLEWSFEYCKIFYFVIVYFANINDNIVFIYFHYPEKQTVNMVSNWTEKSEGVQWHSIKVKYKATSMPNFIWSWFSNKQLCIFFYCTEESQKNETKFLHSCCYCTFNKLTGEGEDYD